MSKCIAGDKVRVIKDVEHCDTIKKGDIVEINYVSVEYGEYYVKGHNFNDGSEDSYWLREEEFELVNEPTESDKKYIWYLDSGDSVYFLNEYTDVVKLNNKHYTKDIEATKNGENVGYLLTEEQAEQSPFFDKFAKHDPFGEKWYYIRMKGNDEDYLNLNFDDDSYFMDDEDERGFYKVKFTEEECNEIIGTSSILYKELV